jgi:ring-1,2-phenylacetyl-CoA epoxidase subunit PaaE
MTKFHPLKVTDVRRETADTVSIAFEVPEAEKDLFAFKAGQYLTIRTDINGEDIRRSYSICASPFEHELRVAIKKVEGGKFSTWANKDLKKGDILDVMPPMGHFTPQIESSKNKSYLLVAAGSGITPILSIIKTLLLADNGANITLIYGNKGNATIIFKEELEALKNKYMNRLTLIHVFSKEQLDTPLLNGRLNGEKLGDLCKVLIDLENLDEVYICGPTEMTESVKDWLIQSNFNKDNIFFELFNTPLPTAGSKENPKAEIIKKFEGEFSHVTVILDGKETHFELATNGDTILDAATKHGADAPYACKGAVCCTCRAQIVEGEVQMDLNYSLTEAEVANGFILTCQAHPTTENVVINFDVA